MGQPGHFRGRRFQAGVGPLKGSRSAAEDRVLGGSFNGGMPVIEPGTDAGGTGGEIIVEPDRKNREAKYQNSGHGQDFQFWRPIQSQEKKAQDTDAQEPAQFGVG